VLLLGRYLLGVRRAENGPHDLDVFPQFGDVAFAQGRVVCHKGIIQVSWGAAPAAQMELVVPDGMTVLAGLPGDGPLFLNGTPAAEVETVARYQKMYRCVRLEAGCHRLS
jgi:hypothetical protein